jgi:hypothetical protein
MKTTSTGTQASPLTEFMCQNCGAIYAESQGEDE